MTDKEKYAVHIALVKEECKDVDEDEVAKEFERYENEFLICLLYTSDAADE